MLGYLYKDFPKPGVNFVDFSPLLADPNERARFLSLVLQLHEVKKFDCVVGIESRGFILGAMVATVLNLPFIMIRKKGKLPGKVLSASYGLEYGKDTIEMQVYDKGLGNVLLVDDVYATGGTITAAKGLCEANNAASVTGFCLFDIGITEVPEWLATLCDITKTDKTLFSEGK